MISIYTDGGCNNYHSEKIGAWAFILFKKTNEDIKQILNNYRSLKEGSTIENNNFITYKAEGVTQTSNNKMELSAAIFALKEYEKLVVANPQLASEEVFLYSDSMYLINGINAWIEKWKENNWKTYKGSEVKNKDLWELLDNFKNKYSKIKFVWVKGHDVDDFNIECDSCVQECIRELDEKIKNEKIN